MYVMSRELRNIGDHEIYGELLVWELAIIRDVPHPSRLLAIWPYMYMDA